MEVFARHQGQVPSTAQQRSVAKLRIAADADGNGTFGRNQRAFQDEIPTDQEVAVTHPVHRAGQDEVALDIHIDSIDRAYGPGEDQIASDTQCQGRARTNSTGDREIPAGIHFHVTRGVDRAGCIHIAV